MSFWNKQGLLWKKKKKSYFSQHLYVLILSALIVCWQMSKLQCAQMYPNTTWLLKHVLITSNIVYVFQEELKMFIYQTVFHFTFVRLKRGQGQRRWWYCLILFRFIFCTWLLLFMFICLICISGWCNCVCWQKVFKWAQESCSKTEGSLV